MYLLFPSLGVMHRVSTALHLHVVHDDDITRQLTNYDENDKFVAYLYSILQKITVNNKVIVTSHPEIVRKLHAWSAASDRVLKKSVFVTYELDISWDPSICLSFIGDDLPWYTTCILFELPSIAADLSRKLIPPPPLWFSHNASALIP